MIDSMAKDLSKRILLWWETAQYWCHGDRNVFDEAPDFVKQAARILGQKEPQ